MIAAVIAGTGLALTACGGNTEAVAPAPETAAAATTSAPAQDTAAIAAAVRERTVLIQHADTVIGYMKASSALIIEQAPRTAPVWSQVQGLLKDAAAVMQQELNVDAATGKPNADVTAAYSAIGTAYNNIFADGVATDADAEPFRAAIQTNWIATGFALPLAAKPAAPSTTAAPAPAALDPANQAAFIDLNGAISMLNPVIEKIVWAPTSDGKVVIGARMWRDFIGKQDPQSWVSQGYWVADNVAGTNAKALNEPAYVFSPKGVEQHDELYATYQADLAPLTSAVLSGALYR